MKESRPPASWPSQIAYQDALQNPRLCFTDADLQTAVPLDFAPFGLPAPIAGQFANVYRLRKADGQIVAMRVFLRRSIGEERTARYRAFADYLASLSPDQTPPALVAFHYQAQGIRVGDSILPMMQMDWVNGAPLNQWVEAHLNQPAALINMAQQWKQMAGALEAARIAHGDLQHGNILVEAGGALRLVDYDGVWVPPLAGQTAREVGHPNYQHPLRAPSDFGPFLDRFSLLVIFAALHLCAVAPDLWYRFDDGDNLLFHQHDFANPAASRLFDTAWRAVRRVPNAARVVTALRDACAVPLVSVPRLSDVL